MVNHDKLIAAVDCDGVILNFLRQWEIAAAEVLGREIFFQVPEYNLDLRYGITRDEFETVWRHFYAAGHWAEIPPIDGAVDAVKRLVECGLDVHVVTAIEPSVLSARMINFINVGMPEVQIHAVSKTKYHKLAELAPVVYFDDHALHIEEALKAGVPNRIHIPNAPQDVISQHATHRASSLARAVEYFLSLYPALQPTQKPSPIVRSRDMQLA